MKKKPKQCIRLTKLFVNCEIFEKYLRHSGLRSGEKKTVEGRKTGIDFLSYENYNEDVEE